MDNDNDSGRDGAAHPDDSHGRAAMLLLESLIHGLLARSVITLSEAIEIVDIAIDARMEIEADGADRRDATPKPVGILETLSASLKADLPLS